MGKFNYLISNETFKNKKIKETGIDERQLNTVTKKPKIIFKQDIKQDVKKEKVIQMDPIEKPKNINISTLNDFIQNTPTEKQIEKPKKINISNLNSPSKNEEDKKNIPIKENLSISDRVLEPLKQLKQSQGNKEIFNIKEDKIVHEPIKPLKQPQERKQEYKEVKNINEGNIYSREVEYLKERFKEYNIAINKIEEKINKGTVTTANTVNNEVFTSKANIEEYRKEENTNKNKIFKNPSPKKDRYDEIFEDYNNPIKSNKYTQDEISSYLFNGTDTIKEKDVQEYKISGDTLNNIYENRIGENPSPKKDNPSSLDKYTKDDINNYIYPGGFQEKPSIYGTPEVKTPKVKIDDKSINNVKKLVKLKLYAEALGVCNDILRSNKIDKDVYLYLGIIHYSMGNYDESIENYTIGIKNDSKNYKLYNNRGTAYIEKKEYVFAILDFTRAIDLMPSLATLYENRAKAYFKIDMYEEALQDTDTALGIDNSKKMRIVKGEILCKLKRYDESISEYNKLIEEGYNDKNIYLNIAEVYFEKKDYERAITNVKRVMDSNPRDYKPYYMMGDICFAKREISNAINNYIKVLEINKSYSYAYFKLGLCYFSLDEYKKCIENMNNAEINGIRDVELFSNRGESYLALGQYDEAIRDFNEAIGINPSSFGTYFDRGVAYTNLKIYDKAYNDLMNSKRLMEADGNSQKYKDVILTVDKMLLELNNAFENKSTQ